MDSIDTSTTVGQIVARHPAAARAFERLGIDYCCGGKKSLAEACASKGLDATTLAQMLKATDGPAADVRNWSAAPLAELIGHILSTHHEYLRRELPRLGDICAKVAVVHGERHRELEEVRRTFDGLRGELEEHMMKEERILFPSIVAMEQGGDGPMHCGGIDRPIMVMEHEHDSAGRALATLRQLTKDYAVPPDACNTYRVMLASLEEMEKDLHEHISKENNILFPRALEMAAARV